MIQSSRNQVYQVDNQARAQTFSKIRAILDTAKQDGFDRVCKESGVSNEKWQRLQRKIDVARNRYVVSLLRPKRNRYVDPAIPKELVDRLEKLAQLQGIHPRSFDIVFDPNSTQYVDASLRCNKNLFGYCLKDPEITLSTDCVKDYACQPNQFLDYISQLISYKRVTTNLQSCFYCDNSLDQTITRLIKATGFELCVLDNEIRSGSLRQSFDKGRINHIKKDKATQYFYKLTYLQADLLGSLEHSERAYSHKIALTKTFPLIEFQYPFFEDTKHFHKGITKKWIDVICRAHQGVSFEKLEPEINWLLNEQKRRLHGFNWKAYNASQMRPLQRSSERFDAIIQLMIAADFAYVFWVLLPEIRKVYLAKLLARRYAQYPY